MSIHSGEAVASVEGSGAAAVPELSLVLPCYNEEAILEVTACALAEAFRQAGVGLQLVLVDNGSTDRTSAVISQLRASGLPITKGVVPVNQGQGFGLLSGFDLCRGRYIGYVSADGQVAAEDVVVVFNALKDTTVATLAKARRRYRPDSLARRVVSICYNILMQLTFPGMPSLDVNGNPKIMPAETLMLMELRSRDWFLEAEVMLKAQYLRLPVVEIDVFGQLREGGCSHVRMATAWEFMRNILRYRLGGPWRGWRRRVSMQGVREGCVSE